MLPMEFGRYLEQDLGCTDLDLSSLASADRAAACSMVPKHTPARLANQSSSAIQVYGGLTPRVPTFDKDNRIVDHLTHSAGGNARGGYTSMLNEVRNALPMPALMSRSYVPAPGLLADTERFLWMEVE